MVIIGLTGSIGMGKTRTAEKFSALGVPTFDSDLAVHGLMAPGGAAYALVTDRFPAITHQGSIDRQKLGAVVYQDDQALHDLENILHPLVRMAQQNFIRRCVLKGMSMVLLDIPLLFETGGQSRCDVVVVVSAPAFLQARRVLSRPAMDEEKFRSILARQLPDYIKRQRADFVISTGLSHGHSFEQIVTIIDILQDYDGSVWSPGCAQTRRI